MRTRKVNRYYCDFCKKAGCNAGHLKRHERGCTMNPERECGVCKVIEGDQKPIDWLTCLLPDPSEFKFTASWGECFSGELTGKANGALPALRKAASNCPACILAAIRQAGIPVPMVTDFNYKDEMRNIWPAITDAQRE